MNCTTITITTLALSAPAVLAGGYSTYTDRNSFEMNTGALSIEDFESEPLGNFAPPTLLDSGLGIALPVGSVDSYIGAGNPDNFGFENTTLNGRNYLAFGRNIPVAGAPDMPQTGAYSAEFSFGGQVNAFGFDLSGAEFLVSAIGFNVSTFNNGQLIDDFFFPSDQLFSTRFYGIVTGDAFDSIRINLPVIGNTGVADYVAFDDVSWGVPSPSAMSLLALGGLAAARRRR
ncbi:MAG: hypothetical protein KDA29_03460 [Phycisphaerales bacterium]|nr:hypothetical protein [Phycisphaerales bacterium]